MRNRRSVRRRRYGSTRRRPQVLWSIIALAIIVGGFYAGARYILTYFDAGNTVKQTGAELVLEDSPSVSVSIEGDELKPGINGQRLFPGDRLTTGPGTFAQLRLFDGTSIRLSELSDVTVVESMFGTASSRWNVQLNAGSLWIATPSQLQHSGAIVRQITTKVMKVALPSKTELVLSNRDISVFAADGIGVHITANQASDPVVVGEGQQFSFPLDVSANTDLYVYRSPLDPQAADSDFLLSSRESKQSADTADSELRSPPQPVESGDDVILAVTAPANSTKTTLSTITVAGRINDDVSRVRVNGYNAPIDTLNNTFSLELVLPNQDDIEIVVMAMSETDDVLSEVRRSVERNRQPPSKPTITSPARDGTTYQTSRRRFTIEGAAPPEAVGILVNGYRLQLFNLGDTGWSYLASTSIDNLKPGENRYEVVAINEGGYKSEPAVITIVLAEGFEGVVEEAPTEAGADEPDVVVTQDDLPDNEPVGRGSLKVTGPTPGLLHTATGSAFLIEGTTSPNTNSLWVNDYRLRLYEPGQDFWNYIADADLGTLKRGRNVYNIITRDKDNRIIDEINYVVTY